MLNQSQWHQVVLCLVAKEKKVMVVQRMLNQKMTSKDMFQFQEHFLSYNHSKFKRVLNQMEVEITEQDQFYFKQWIMMEMARYQSVNYLI